MDYGNIHIAESKRKPLGDRVLPAPPSQVYRVKGLKGVKSREKTIPAIEQEIPFGTKVGILTIGPRTPIGKARLFSAACDCGRYSLFTAEQIWANLRDGIGCGEDDCSAASLPQKLWRDADTSLKMQLMIRVAVEPQDVFSFWGGTLEDGYRLSFTESTQHFVEYCKKRMPSPDHFWAVKECPALPFIEGNILMQDAPDTFFQDCAQRKLCISGNSYGVSELAEIMDLTEGEVLNELFHSESMEQLIYNLTLKGE